MLVLGIDFETQDDKAETTNITEVGVILEDFSQPDKAFDRPNDVFQSLVYSKDYPPQTSQIVELTGITDHMMLDRGRNIREVFEDFLPLVEQADLIVAHNTSFDRVVFEAEMKRQKRLIPDKKWLCTLTEIPYPEKYTCKKLSHLAWEHDIQVDRSALHRADYDVKLMLQLLAKYDLKKVLEYKAEPWCYLHAIFDAPWVDGGVGKAKAQKLKYGWEKAHGDDRVFPKQWMKRVKQSRVKDELEKAQKINLHVRSL